MQCVVTCEEGYGFAVDQPSNFDPGDSMILTCGLNESTWNSTYFPDCSGTSYSKSQNYYDHLGVKHRYKNYVL